MKDRSIRKYTSKTIKRYPPHNLRQHLAFAYFTLRWILEARSGVEWREESNQGRITCVRLNDWNRMPLQESSRLLCRRKVGSIFVLEPKKLGALKVSYRQRRDTWYMYATCVALRQAAKGNAARGSVAQGKVTMLHRWKAKCSIRVACRNFGLLVLIRCLVFVTLPTLENKYSTIDSQTRDQLSIRCSLYMRHFVFCCRFLEGSLNKWSMNLPNNQHRWAEGMKQQQLRVAHDCSSP